MSITELNERSREVFRHIVDSYLLTGEPIGSRTLSQQTGINLSPASLRNIMAELEETGLIYAPHTSAGRMPTELGLRFYVRGVLEIGNITDDERAQISGQCVTSGRSIQQALTDATQTLSGLSRCTSLVLSPKTDYPLKHIEFVQLSPGRVLVVIVTENGIVENRIIETPAGLPPASLVEATNYLSYHLIGKNMREAREVILQELAQHKAQLDNLTEKVVRAGLASWANPANHDSLIIRGQANLLEDITAVEELERIRHLFGVLESKETYAKLLESAESAEGVQIYIGSENNLFGTSGCSMITAPFADEGRKVIGTIGVIGPTRLNYARIIPMVDYTAKIISQMMDGNKEKKHATGR